MHPTTKLLVLFCIAAAAVSSSTHAAVTGGGDAALCAPHEREALLEFKRGITSDPTGQLASWRRDGEQDCCRWRGVWCSRRTGHVRELHLRNVHANNTFLIDDSETAPVGQISPSLLSLRHLVHLDLSVQELQGPTGHVPEFLGSFKKMRYLNLSCIPFIGRVPPHLGNLSRLQSLDLSQSNHVFLSYGAHLSSTDISWLTRLPMLRYLNMQYVNLSLATDWARVVNTLPSLTALCLSQCSPQSANQSLPHHNLTNLEDLDLSENYFVQPSASCWFWNITSLRHLNVRWSSNLYGQPPSALGGLKHLQVLIYSSNRMGTMTPSMRNLCNLEILDLSENFLHGNIFEMLPRCSPNKLTELHLEYNYVTGLPRLIGEFVNIVTLDMSNNQLTGHIPSEIGMLNKLAYLDLSNGFPYVRNEVIAPRTPIVFGGSKKSAYMDLSNNSQTEENQLIGPIPSEIGRLNNLAYMDLSGNNIGGVVTEELFANLTSLEKIYLADNSLKVVVDPECHHLFSLIGASFASCHMGPLFPAWLKWQVGLSYLDISSAGIADRLPDWFSTSFANVSIMIVSENGINGSLPTNMKVMTSLTRLYLDSNQLTGQIPQLPVGLDILDLSRNSLSGFPSNFGAPYILELKLYSNLLTGHVPESICGLQGLGILDLSNNHLEGEFPPCFQPTDPWILLFSNNRFTGKFPSFVQNFKGLYILDLSWNNFSGRLPLWIGELVNLEVLRLSHNMFSHSIPTTVTNLTRLVHLNLASNSMSGVIPQNLSSLIGMQMGNSPTSFPSNTLNMSVFTKGQELNYHDTRIFDMVIIDISSNFLTGGIPEELVTLHGILSLNLSWNDLSGKISNKIGAMQSVESLDLSRNRFYGEIPQSLSNLSYLSYLDLSYHDLSGTIPSGGQLDTLYEEYTHLCTMAIPLFVDILFPITVQTTVHQIIMFKRQVEIQCSSTLDLQ
ncbi:hypothetical protein ACQ4PT_014309 [Festuca glaucescens]